MQEPQLCLTEAAGDCSLGQAACSGVSKNKTRMAQMERNGHSCRSSSVLLEDVTVIFTALAVAISASLLALNQLPLKRRWRKSHSPSSRTVMRPTRSFASSQWPSRCSPSRSGGSDQTPPAAASPPSTRTAVGRRCPEILRGHVPQDAACSGEASASRTASGGSRGIPPARAQLLAAEPAGTVVGPPKAP